MGSEQPLVLVHLSSLDSYEQIEGRSAAMELAEGLIKSLNQQRGPVFALDQHWELNPQNRARQRLLHTLWTTPATIIPHDDRQQRWEPVIETLDQKLKAINPEHVKMGGFWYNSDRQSGCVTYLERKLQQRGHDIVVYPAITGREDIRL